MQAEGQVEKMRVAAGEPAAYSMVLDGELYDLEGALGGGLRLEYLNKITCMVCGRATKKSFQQGFCFPCMRNSAQASECIIHPERCRGHEGEGRDPEWEQRHHVQGHVVYLALASQVKVGVTRSTQMPVRWYDQGASAAIVVAHTPNRYLAGCIEVALKDIFVDKTNWRKMLKGEVPGDVDLAAEKERCREVLGSNSEWAECWRDEEPVVHLQYPVETYPEKVTSLGFDKQPVIEGVLQGIKGQYLILDGGRVVNVRKHRGYHVRFSY